MKLIIDALRPVKEALLAVTENVGMYEAVDATVTHIIYAPDSEAGELALDNAKTGQVIQGTVDLFAKNKDQGMADSVQHALGTAGISFRLESIQYEDLNKNDFVHYEWVFEVA